MNPSLDANSSSKTDDQKSMATDPEKPKNRVNFIRETQSDLLTTRPVETICYHKNDICCHGGLEMDEMMFKLHRIQEKQRGQDAVTNKLKYLSGAISKNDDIGAHLRGSETKFTQMLVT